MNDRRSPEASSTNSRNGKARRGLLGAIYSTPPFPLPASASSLLIEPSVRTHQCSAAQAGSAKVALPRAGPLRKELAEALPCLFREVWRTPSHTADQIRNAVKGRLPLLRCQGLDRLPQDLGLGHRPASGQLLQGTFSFGIESNTGGHGPPPPL